MNKITETFNQNLKSAKSEFEVLAMQYQTFDLVTACENLKRLERKDQFGRDWTTNSLSKFMNKHGYRKRSFFTKKKKVKIEPPQQATLEVVENPAAKELSELSQVLNADLPETLKLKFCKLILDKAV